MKIVTAAGVMLIIVAGYLYWQETLGPSSISREKVYVTAEGAGDIVAVDPKNKKIKNRIVLYRYEGGKKINYMPHNVQVAPDKKTVWVTANAVAENKHTQHSLRFIPATHAHATHHKDRDPSDEVIVIDPKTEKIIKRLPLGSDLHLAHIDLTPNSSYALVASQKKNEIYKINTRTMSLANTIKLDDDAEPHGLRLSMDGKRAYVAAMNGRSLVVINLESASIESIPLSGDAIQIAVTPDGKKVAASIFSTRKIAVYDTLSGRLSEYPLPSDARGPVQISPTTDSRYVYVADQGVRNNQPEGNRIFKLNIEEGIVEASILSGRAPHGVAVSGSNVYVTNVNGNDLSIIRNDKEISRIKVGKGPNGVSVWTP